MVRRALVPHEQELGVERRVDDRAHVLARAVLERSHQRGERLVHGGFGGGRRRLRQRRAGLVARDQRRQLVREGRLATATVADDGDELSSIAWHFVAQDEWESRWRTSHELR